METEKNVPQTAASHTGFGSLQEIRDRKEALRRQISKSDGNIRLLWRQLFTKPEPLASLTPTKRVSKLMSTGAGVLDGVILGWKLYRKFKKKK